MYNNTRSLFDTFTDGLYTYRLKDVFPEFTGVDGLVSNVQNSKDGTTVYLEMPGIPPENLDIQLENGILKVAGEVKEDNKEGLPARKIEKSWKIPNSTDPDKINAKLRYGMLTLSLPKKDEIKPKEIPVFT